MFGSRLLFVISVAAALHMPLNSYPRGKKIVFDGDDAGKKLNLSPYIKRNRIAEARDRSLVTTKWFTSNITSYAGFLTVDKKCDSALFFWFFPSLNKPKTDPVSLWLQGGPGSTSFFGLLAENGPYNLRTDGKIELREYSWNRNSSIIYIDNPVGTGYSYTRKGCYVTNQSEVGRDLLNALEQFFQIFPEYGQNPFFFTGESYAGKYIPAAAYAIMKANSSINLQGIMIGNALIDPRHQTESSTLLYQLGLIDIRTRDAIIAREELCQQAIDVEDYHTANFLSDTLYVMIKKACGLESFYNIFYNKGDKRPDIDRFVTQLKVRTALHVGNATWNGDHSTVRKHLSDDIQRSVRPWFEELLEKYRVLLYNGQLDLMVAYPATMSFVQQLNWSKAEEYKMANRRIWTVGSDIAGYAKSAGDFTEVLVRNAGHMVPTDQPEWALDLYNKFIFNQQIGG